MNYIKFFKPFEVLSQFTDEEGRETLKDYIPIPDVYAAGRLDYRSEGLMILSDDGMLLHRLTHPRYDHHKTYLAQVEGVVDQDAVDRLNREILLPGLQTKIAEAHIIPEPELPPRPKPVRQYHPTTWLRITLNEGKKHQVRKMTAAVGYPTLRLVREAIGPITLGDLQPGDWRFLTPVMIRELKSMLGLNGRRTSGKGGRQ